MKSLNSYTQRIVKPVFEKHGFSDAALVAGWAEIIGEEFGRVSAPERIKWPRSRTDKEKGQPLAGTLVLRVAQGHALLVQHKIPMIIERVNTFFGFQAITDVKIRQGVLPKRHRTSRARPPELDDDAKDALSKKLDSVADESLRASLERLGAAALARKARLLSDPPKE